MQVYKRLKDGNKILVLFFCGWGMDEKCISHIDSDNIDVMVFFDYRGDISCPEINLSKYESVHVVAWSMGVWVANQLIGDISSEIDKKIAFCGSPCPVDDNYGIPLKIFDITLEGLKRTGTVKFFSRMLNGLSDTNFHKPDRELEEQIEELNNLKVNSLKSELKEVKWNKVVIGMKDKIFPSANLMNYWDGKSIIVKSDLPHYPFDQYDTWEKILNV
jgi:biotin synthesis protein BioG